MLTIRDVEDIAIIRNLRAARAASEEIHDMQEDIAFAREMKIALQDKNAQINKLRRELTDLIAGSEGRNKIIQAEQLVKKHFIAEYAKAVGKPEEEVKQLANALRRKAFDRFVDDGLQNGTLAEDPRKTGDLVEWYSSLP